jgi:hypothetical protein
MPNTTPDNIYYPDDSTEVDDLAGIFADQATSVQAALAAIRTSLAPVPVSDTGWLLTGLTVASGWSGIADSVGSTSAPLKGGMRKVGSHVELRFRVTRTGAAITANAQGNFGDNLIATINNTALRPAGNIYASFDITGTGMGGCRIEPDGTINVVDAYPSAKINSGAIIQVTANYFTG